MVSTATTVGLGVSALVVLSLPVAAYLICRGRMELRARNILVGAGCFLFFSVVLESLASRYILVVNPQTVSWFETHRLAHAFYLALAAGVFEETGRFCGLSFLVRQEDGAGVAYGIGHGGIEAILLVGFRFAVLLLVALLVNQGRLNAISGGHFPPAVLAQLEQMTWVRPLEGTLERTSVFVVQIALSLIVWRAVRMKRPLLFVVAILAHTALDAPSAMLRVRLIHINSGSS